MYDFYPYSLPCYALDAHAVRANGGRSSVTATFGDGKETAESLRLKVVSDSTECLMQSKESLKPFIYLVTERRRLSPRLKVVSDSTECLMQSKESLKPFIYLVTERRRLSPRLKVVSDSTECLMQSKESLKPFIYLVTERRRLTESCQVTPQNV